MEFAKRAGEASTAGSMYTLEAIKKVKPWYKAAQKGVTVCPPDVRLLASCMVPAVPLNGMLFCCGFCGFKQAT